MRKARRILERAWELNPHPDVADAYAHVRLGDSARERLARVQKLAERAPGNREGALAVARSALEAREFEIARAALSPYLAAPTQRVAALMAEIEEAEYGDTGRVREWMSRAVHASGDPVWTAEGVVSDKWLPVTPSGKLDGFEWKVPLAELGVTRPVIEMPSAPPSVAPLTIAETAPAETTEHVSAEPAVDVHAAVEEPAVGSDDGVLHAETAAEKPPEPIIPLVHAPDDPGPEGSLEGDLEREAVARAEDKRWGKIKDLFK
jgi:HemY protein